MNIRRTQKPVSRTVVIAARGQTQPIAMQVGEENVAVSREEFIHVMARLIRKGEVILAQESNIGAKESTRVEFPPTASMEESGYEKMTS